MSERGKRTVQRGEEILSFRPEGKFRSLDGVMEGFARTARQGWGNIYLHLPAPSILSSVSGIGTSCLHFLVSELTTEVITRSPYIVSYHITSHHVPSQYTFGHCMPLRHSTRSGQIEN